MTDETMALIEAEKNAPPLYVPPVPISVGQGGTTKPIEAKELINTAINTAIVERIKRDESVQAKFIKTADTVIREKLERQKALAAQSSEEEPGEEGNA